MVNRFKVVHETALLVSVAVEHVPFVAEAERIAVRSSGSGFHSVELHYGFMETPFVPAALDRALGLIGVATPLSDLLYVLGRETFVASPSGDMGRVAESIFAFMSRNARSATDHFGIPPTQVIELGAQIDL